MLILLKCPTDDCFHPPTVPNYHPIPVDLPPPAYYPSANHSLRHSAVAAGRSLQATTHPQPQTLDGFWTTTIAATVILQPTTITAIALVTIRVVLMGYSLVAMTVKVIATVKTVAIELEGWVLVSWARGQCCIISRYR